MLMSTGSGSHHKRSLDGPNNKLSHSLTLNNPALCVLFKIVVFAYDEIICLLGAKLNYIVLSGNRFSNRLTQ